MSVNTNTAEPGSFGPGSNPAASGFSFSWMEAPNLGVSRTPMSETLTNAHAKSVESIKTIPVDPKIELAVIMVDNNKLTKLQLSSLIVLMRPKDTNQKVSSYYTLLLEGSAPPLEARVVPINGQNFTEDIYSEQVYDAVYAAATAQVVDDFTKGYKNLPISGTVVPREFNWDDKEALRIMLTNAICACAQELQSKLLPNGGELNLNEAVKDAGLTVTISYNQPDRKNAVGQPFRADLAINLTAVALERGDPATLNHQQRSRLLATAAGFIEPMWLGVDTSAQQPFGQYGAPVSKRVFAPRLTLTQTESFTLMTPGMQLLILGSTGQFAENGAWFSYWKPRPQGQLHAKVDIRDIGAINIEGNLFNEPDNTGTKIDTKSTNYEDKDLGGLLTQLMQPNLMIALDVPVLGPDTWYNEIFAAAAAGNRGATQALFAAADAVTGGNFGKIFNGTEAVIQIEEVVLLGNYGDQQGNVHDIRDGDYLAVMNLAGEQEPKIGAIYSDTFLRTETPLIKRLADRKRILDRLFGPVNWTGTARRVTLDGKFLLAFQQAVAACGISIRTINPGANSEYASQRAGAAFFSQAGMAINPSGLFNNGYASSSTPQAGRQFFAGKRW